MNFEVIPRACVELRSGEFYDKTDPTDISARSLSVYRNHILPFPLPLLFLSPSPFCLCSFCSSSLLFYYFSQESIRFLRSVESVSTRLARALSYRSDFPGRFPCDHNARTIRCQKNLEHVRSPFTRRSRHASRVIRVDRGRKTSTRDVRSKELHVLARFIFARVRDIRCAFKLSSPRQDGSTRAT